MQTPLKLTTKLSLPADCFDGQSSCKTLGLKTTHCKTIIQEPLHAVMYEFIGLNINKSLSLKTTHCKTTIQ